MKKKIISVLLCVALLLTLSINVSADILTEVTQPANDAQTTPITDETTVGVGESSVEIIEDETSIGNAAMPLSQNTAIISGGIYRIKNVASSKYMNVDYGIDVDGTNIYQWTGDGSTEQKWKVVYSSSTDSYLLYSMCSSNGTNRVADVYDQGGNLVAGSNIKLNEPDEPPSQQVQIIQVSSGKYRIAMKQNNNFVYTAYGTSNGSASGTTSTSVGNIFLSTYTGATNQQWQFELLENPNPTPVGNLDAVSTTLIGGWAYQSNIPNTALTVHIYIINDSTGEEHIIPVTANGYRPDLEIAGYGNGYHAFQYNINWKTYKPGKYIVRAYAIGVNSINPQLNNSPKSYTVRNPAGNVEYVDQRGIGGWVWKPDAPNSAIDVHIYIYKSDNTQVAFYPVTASQPRSDLASAGYGNGNHGFSKTIDWSILPKEELRVVAYAVDGSGYNPSFYSGYYNNAPPHGAITLYGIYFKNEDARNVYYTNDVRTAISNIGVTATNGIFTGTTSATALYRMKNSMIWSVHTHGSKTTVKLNNSAGEVSRIWYDDISALSDNALKSERCVIYGTCNAGEGREGAENMVNITHQKGAMTVIGWEGETKVSQMNTWLAAFLVSCGEGKIIDTAIGYAIDEVYDKHDDVLGGLEKIYCAGSTTQKLVS